MNHGNTIRIMSVMAHQDDFEFNAGGVFTQLRRRYGDHVDLKILATTRGASGHHASSLEETYRRREAEAEKSAELIEASYECLTCLDGSHLHGNVFIDRNTLGGLWNAVRGFQPHYVFCPPMITNPLAGIHIDHYNTAWAVRMIAYQLTVPHAYPIINGSMTSERGVYPVIVNVDDTYAVENGWHVSVDIDDCYEEKVRMALCHESQIFEWLPWNGQREKPSKDEFRAIFRKRHSDVNQRNGRDDKIPREYFQLTSWGKRPSKSDLDDLLGKYEISEEGLNYVHDKST